MLFISFLALQTGEDPNIWRARLEPITKKRVKLDCCKIPRYTTVANCWKHAPCWWKYCTEAIKSQIAIKDICGSNSNIPSRTCSDSSLLDCQHSLPSSFLFSTICFNALVMPPADWIRFHPWFSPSYQSKRHLLLFMIVLTASSLITWRS